MRNRKRVAELLVALKAEMTTNAEKAIIDYCSNRLNEEVKEVWRDVPGYDGHYQVSNIGNVRSNKRQSMWLPMKIGHIFNKYYGVALTKNGQVKHCAVHILVAKTFIPNPENKPFVNHKDGNKFNNCVENLEWVTGSENVRHAFKLGLNKGVQGFNHGAAKFTAEEIREIRNNYKAYDRKRDIPALAKKYGVCTCTMKNIINGKSYKNVK